MWIHLQIDGTRKFSRRRRTYALCQHSPQQAQTRMSRCALLGPNKRALRVLRHRAARLRRAEAHDKAPIEALKPVRCGFSSDGDWIGPSDCCVRQRNWGHGQASLREIVLAALPRPSPAPQHTSSPATPKFSRCAFLTFDMIRLPSATRPRSQGGSAQARLDGARRASAATAPR